MRGLRHHPRAFPAIPFPPRWRPDACPVMAPAGLPGDDLSRHGMRSLRWRSDARFTRVGDQAGAITGLNHALAAHPMVRSCPPNAWRISRAATIDRDRLHAMIPRKMATISVAGTASGCMRWLGGTTPEGRANLPAMLAPAGAAWDGVRMRSFSTRLDAMAVACLPWDGVRGPFLRFRSPPGRPPDACLWDAARKRSP